MSKYTVKDDGKVVGGKVVVFVASPGADRAPAAGVTPAAAKAAAKAQAAGLRAAAATGAAFCEECESARRQLAGMRRQSQ